MSSHRILWVGTHPTFTRRIEREHIHFIHYISSLFVEICLTGLQFRRWGGYSDTFGLNQNNLKLGQKSKDLTSVQYRTSHHHSWFVQLHLYRSSYHQSCTIHSFSNQRKGISWRISVKYFILILIFTSWHKIVISSMEKP